MRLAADAVGAGRLASPTVSASLQNPICGDRITIDILLEDGQVKRIGHETKACLLCQAAASLLAEKGVDRDAADIIALAEAVKAWLSGKNEPPSSPWESFAHFLPVLPYKTRHTCVLLPLEAATKALKSKGL